MSDIDPAQQALDLIEARGLTWRERAVQPPPYTPDLAQIKDLWRDLLGEVVEGNANHGARRHLRVRRTTSLVTIPRDVQRFALEVEAPGGWAVCAVVDAGGAFVTATDTPAPPPADELDTMPRAQLVEHVRALRAKVGGDAA